MPVFTPSSLDAHGNPVDGYEVNQRSLRDDIYLPPDFSERDVVEALVEVEVLGFNALKMFDEKRLVVETGGQDIELLEREVAWARLREAGDEPEDVESVFLDMKGSFGRKLKADVAQRHGLEEDEIVEEEGFRPVMMLSEVIDEDPEFQNRFDFEVFWRESDDFFALVRVVKGQPQAVAVWNDAVDGWSEFSIAEFQREGAPELTVALDNFLETGEVSQAVRRAVPPRR